MDMDMERDRYVCIYMCVHVDIHIYMHVYLLIWKLTPRPPRGSRVVVRKGDKQDKKSPEPEQPNET